MLQRKNASYLSCGPPHHQAQASTSKKKFLHPVARTPSAHHQRTHTTAPLLFPVDSHPYAAPSRFFIYVCRGPTISFTPRVRNLELRTSHSLLHLSHIQLSSNLSLCYLLTQSTPVHPDSNNFILGFPGFSRQTAGITADRQQSALSPTCLLVSALFPFNLHSFYPLQSK